MRIPLSAFVAGSILIALAPPTFAQSVGGGLLPQYMAYGEAWADRMGYSVASAGDVNADGVEDVIIGAIGTVVAGAPRGAAFVYSGADGSELYRFDGINLSGNFGFSVAGAGDVNGDGYDDVIIGAPYVNSASRTNEGRAYVYSGFDGQKLHRFDGLNAEDRLGFSVSGAGDIDGDGLADLLVGSIWADNGAMPNAGAVDIFSGATGAVLYHFGGGSPGDYFGYSVSDAGDVNADGIPDVIVGAANVDLNGKTDTGRAYVYSGATGNKLHRIDGTNAYDWLGFSVSGTGDFDSDGYDDFLVGALLADPDGLTDAGSAFLYSGQTGALLHRFDGAAAGDDFGGSVDGGNDVDGDGQIDIIIGATGAAPKGMPFAGSAYVFSGSDYSLIHQVDGFAENDFMGHSVACLSDLGGDGLAEFLVGAHLADHGVHFDAGWFGIMGFHPYLTSDRSEISSSAGGTVNFLMQFPLEHSGQVYKLLGSATGIGPTNLAGLDIPLTDGDFLWDAMLDSKPPNLFSNPVGTLNVNGQANCALSLPPGFAASYVGTTFYFAAIVVNPPTEGLLSSAFVSLPVIP